MAPIYMKIILKYLEQAEPEQELILFVELEAEETMGVIIQVEIDRLISFM